MSHETIYQSLYVQGRGALRRELTSTCAPDERCASPAAQAEAPRPDPGMVNISERPPEVEDRAVPGHWEGDLIIGRPSPLAIGTLVERATGS